MYTSMGARRLEQEGHLPPSLEMLKSFFLLQMLSKTSVDEVFMHHFENMSSASGGKIPTAIPMFPAINYSTVFRPTFLVLPSPQNSRWGKLPPSVYRVPCHPEAKFQRLLACFRGWTFQRFPCQPSLVLPSPPDSADSLQHYCFKNRVFPCPQSDGGMD